MNAVLSRALAFDCEGDTLIGVLNEPAAAAARDTAIVVVVGGPQYRAGSHRQFTLLARALAAAGWPVLRFDVRGMGDSSGTLRDFESTGADIGAAIDALQQALPSVRRVVLWGLCDGASAALLYLQTTRDARVAGLCLANPWVRSEETLARAHVKHYYLQRLMQPAFWRKLASGGVGLVAVRELGASLRHFVAGRPGGGRGAAPLDFRARMLAGFEHFDGPTLLLLSGNDYTAGEFVDLAGSHPGWKTATARSAVRRVNLPDADHTFSERRSEIDMHAACIDWLAARFAPAADDASAEWHTRPTVRQVSA